MKLKQNDSWKKHHEGKEAGMTVYWPGEWKAEEGESTPSE